MAQPHKGARHLFATRVPDLDARWLMDDAAARGITYSEWLAGAVAAIRAGHTDIEAFLPPARPVRSVQGELMRTGTD